MKKLSIILLTLAVLFCGALATPNKTAVSKASITMTEHPPYATLVALFEDNEEENIKQLPAGTVFYWFNQKYLPAYYVGQESFPVAGYDSFADYPDCYWIYPTNPLFPPNNPGIFELAE